MAKHRTTHPTSSWCRGCEYVDPCIHIPRGPSWPVMQIPLPLTINTEGAEKMHIYKLQAKTKKLCYYNKTEFTQQKMVSTNHLRLLRLQQLLKIPTMGVGTLQIALNYCSSNVCESVHWKYSRWLLVRTCHTSIRMNTVSDI